MIICSNCQARLYRDSLPWVSRHGRIIYLCPICDHEINPEYCKKITIEELMI